MLTLKFIRNAVGDTKRREKVYSVSNYEKVKEESDESTVYFALDKQDIAITITSSPANDEYHICYVENSMGKTIDTIRPKQ